jgi:hypothetical protein
MEEKEDPFYCGEEEETTPSRRPKMILRPRLTRTEKTEEMRECERHGHEWQLYTSTLHEERGNDRYVSLDRVIVGGACGHCGVYFKETMKLTPTRRTD